MESFDVEPMGYALGARVRGIDFREPIEQKLLQQLRELWLSNLLLCFPDQSLDKFQFDRFARQFGELEPRSKLNQDSELPGVGYIERKENGYKSGTEWHTDDSYSTRPSSASFLLAKELPVVGGDTVFSNQYLAYESLSEQMQKVVNDLQVLHAPPGRHGRIAPPGERPTVQPVVRVHPETGRKALYVGNHATEIIGMAEDESNVMLTFLNMHAVRGEFTYRHSWSLNDLVMWDNRALLHIALRDYDEEHQPRTMFRATCVGEPSGQAA